MEQIELFRDRFRELWSNWESLRDAGISLGGHFSNQGEGEVRGSGCGMDVHRLKGFYLDFRPFWSSGEATNYFKIASLIGRHCRDRRLHACLRDNREDWKNAGLLHEWHGIRPDEMIDTIFNGELFHSDAEKRKRRRHIRSLLSDELAHHCLVFSIYDRMLVIRNLNWVVEPLEGDNLHVRIPLEYAQVTAANA